MIQFRKNIKPIVVTLLFLLVWANFTLSYFTHSHIDENGNIIIHAHPYQKAEQGSTGVPTHTHTKSEFTLLALIYNLLSLFVFCSLVIIFLFHVNPILKPKFSFQWNPFNAFCKLIFRRGPPSILQLS